MEWGDYILTLDEKYTNFIFWLSLKKFWSLRIWRIRITAIRKTEHIPFYNGLTGKKLWILSFSKRWVGLNHKKCHTTVPLNSKAIRLCNHFQSWRNKTVLDNIIRTFFLNYSRWGIFTFCVACEQKSRRHSCSSGYAIIRCRSALVHRAVL